MLDINKRLLITSDNQKQKNRVINLLKLIPKLKKTKKFKYERPIFKSRNKIFFNSSLFQKEAKSEKDDFKMNNITLINMSDLNNNSIKSFSTKNFQKTNINDIQNTSHKNDINSDTSNTNEKNLNKDRVFNFFNRNFYDSEIQTSKKSELNQKILSYFLKDKEQKEKYQRLKYEEMMQRKNKFNYIKNISLYNTKKKDIKTSLILNDFSMYHKIHKVVRFWGKFVNYAYPIFQVQKFSLASKNYKENKIKFSFENINDKNSFNGKNYKLPVLYTNSSETINKFNQNKLKFISKNRSDLDIKNSNFIKNNFLPK